MTAALPAFVNINVCLCYWCWLLVYETKIINCYAIQLLFSFTWILSNNPAFLSPNCHVSSVEWAVLTVDRRICVQSGWLVPPLWPGQAAAAGRTVSSSAAAESHRAEVHWTFLHQQHTPSPPRSWWTATTHKEASLHTFCHGTGYSWEHTNIFDVRIQIFLRHLVCSVALSHAAPVSNAGLSSLFET